MKSQSQAKRPRQASGTIFLGLLSALVSVLLSACGGRVISGSTPTPASLAVSLATSTVLPTLVPQVLTPAPTNTPAPTPTPAVHIIQPGDTLMGIALQYGVTLDELYQVNGVLKPELLQIGQEIVIPVPGSVGKPTNNDSGAVIAPTQPPLPVQVEHAARYQTPVGSVWVLGEVFNSTDQPIENVQVRVALLNATGQEVGSALPFVALDAIPPGGRAPFSVLFESPPISVIDFQAYVVRADPSYNHTTRYATLEVSEVQTKQEGTQYRVSGQVTNTGATNVSGAQVVITLYDDKEHVSGFRQYALPDDQLGPGRAVTFDVLVSPDPSAPSVANSTVSAQARTR
jgi:LysM repeat protein